MNYAYMHAGTSVERLLALSEGENQNARIYYWTKGINLFLDYPLQSIILEIMGIITVSMIITQKVVGFVY